MTIKQQLVRTSSQSAFQRKRLLFVVSRCERFCEICGVGGMIEFLEEESGILVMSGPWLDFMVLFRLQFRSSTVTIGHIFLIRPPFII